MYEGPSKPKDIDEYMLELTTEIAHLINNGLDDVIIQKGNFIMDTPARSLILDTKQPPGYFSCHKCWIKGVYVKNLRTTSFMGTGNRSRTHEEFIAKTQFNEDDKKKTHHISGFRIALENIPTIDIVKDNKIDYMHCTCSGLMKRKLECWIKTCPFFNENSDQWIETLQRCWPIEFQRKVRSIKFVKKFKASEFRVWLLYVGPAIMKRYLTEEEYQHFCLIHHGIRLLFLTPVPKEENLMLAQQCINKYLEQWPSVYPESALSYVVHATEHLPEDCRNNKTTPDGFSAFPFESFLRRVKRNYHTGGKQLEQVMILINLYDSPFPGVLGTKLRNLCSSN